MNSQELAARFLTVLQGSGTDVTVDLTDEPVAIVAYSKTGRVFAAAWESDEGLVVRLRLDAMAGGAYPQMEYVDGGTLAYEVVMRSNDEVDALGDMLDRARTLATRLAED